jgi:hypothetical protein
MARPSLDMPPKRLVLKTRHLNQKARAGMLACAG